MGDESFVVNEILLGWVNTSLPFGNRLTGDEYFGKCGVTLISDEFFENRLGISKSSIGHMFLGISKVPTALCRCEVRA